MFINLVGTSGIAAVKEIITVAFRKFWKEKKKEPLTPNEAKQIERLAAKMIRAATDDEIRRIDPKVREIERIGRSSGWGKATVKKATRKAPARKKSAAAVSRKTASKKHTAKKAAPNRAMRRGRR